MEIDPNKLTLLEDNPRLISDKNLERLKRDLQDDPDFLQARPVLVNQVGGELIVYAGNMRTKAALELGWDSIPVRIDKDLSKEVMRKRALRDNQEYGEWDQELLAEYWSEELATLDLPELEPIVVEAEVMEDEFNPDEVEKNIHGVVRGDIWQLGEHRLMCGDATSIDDVEKLMDGQKADMVFTDPPYGIDVEKMTLGTGQKAFARQEGWDSERPDINNIFLFADYFCIWGGNYFSDVLPTTNDWLCWHKKNDGLSFSEFELAWTNFGKNTRLISHHWGGEKKLHPTMKPIAVCEWAIGQVDNIKTVLDLFGGSGSTLIACEQTNRKCYIMELDEHYVSVIIERWQKLTNKQALRLNN
jgi:DNA modification methylase